MYTVDGFIFEDEATAQLAQKEEEGIRFIKERTALTNPEVVLKLYNKLIAQDIFVTPVGVRFLLELQNILLASPQIAREDIPPIKGTREPIVVEKEPEKAVQKVTKKLDTKVGGNYKTPFYVALFFALVFGVSVVGIFIITQLSGNNINIINYENAILNKYSTWEVELKEKEAELKDWEKELEERESGQN